MALRLSLLLACLAVAACSLETGPPSNPQVPQNAPRSSLQPGATDFHPVLNG
jgi:hypothetical protein